MGKSDKVKWLIVLPAMLGVVLVTYVERTTDIWGFGAFICQLIAILELAYGLRIAMLAQNRKKSYQLAPEERHEYAKYLYEKQYRRYPAVANQMLFVMARMSVLLGNYERAGEELVDIRTDKCNPVQLKLYYYLRIVTAQATEDVDSVQENLTRFAGIPDVKGAYPSESELAMWIEQRDIVQMAEALKKAVADKKEHPIRIGIITVILAYSTFFYGLWYGINRDMGYEVRYHFAEISIVVVGIGLAVLIIWGIVSLYIHNCQELAVQSGKSRVALIIIYGAAAIFALLILGMSSLSVVLGMDGIETVTDHDSKYTYITVQEDYGGERRYRTNNPFVMQSMDSLWLSSDTTDADENNEESLDTNTGNSSETEDSQSEDTVEDYEMEGQHDGLMIQNAMLAVYNYLQEQNTLQNMAFSYTANAKGEVYAIVSEMQETKDGNTVNVRYCLYDNGSKTDADGNSCEELVLEKVFPDGNYETELVDFYLVNADTMQVTDEQKNTW
ncbi:hypothetical protein [Dorea sp. AF36-15AT]|uniref:hypothetical protein n=1 Tax=Dorea sp. AF36-15AT TaxID=2292041 RepID=UPI000E4796FF|nr:hypothetical protein [Dorea sp. AF36-15AT]RHP07477.1 hypothetical protein DWZ93_11105 [Dorea sp. AF36-15AT]